MWQVITAFYLYLNPQQFYDEDTAGQTYEDSKSKVPDVCQPYDEIPDPATGLLENDVDNA